MATNTYWDTSKPLDSALIPDGPGIWRNLVGNLTVLLGKEHHTFPTDSNSGSYHLPGSANIFVAASAPTTRIDGSAFSSNDIGRVWYDTATGIFKILTAVDADVWTAQPSLTAANDFTGNITVTTDKFTIAAATGNTTIDGTLDIGGSVAIDSVIDDDTMATATDTNVPTSESIVAYVDANAGAANYTPTSQGTEQSTTFPNGLILKHGLVTGTEPHTVTFTDAFPGGILSVSATNYEGAATGVRDAPSISAYSVSAITIQTDTGLSGTNGAFWQAWGY